MIENLNDTPIACDIWSRTSANMETVLINLVRTLSCIEDPTINISQKYDTVRHHFRKFINTIVELKNNGQRTKLTKDREFHRVSKKKFPGRSIQYLESYFRRAILNGVLTYDREFLFKTEQQLCQNVVSDIFTKFKQICNCSKCDGDGEPTGTPPKNYFCCVRLKQTSLITID